jgi:hypothetical protein
MFVESFNFAAITINEGTCFTQCTFPRLFLYIDPCYFYVLIRFCYVYCSVASCVLYDFSYILAYSIKFAFAFEYLLFLLQAHRLLLFL